MNKITDPKRFIIIDNMYNFGMLLVLLGHIGLTTSFNDTYLHRWIYSFHMPLFFWIAGFLFDTKPQGVKFLVRKAKRLLIPLFVLTTIVFVPKVYLSQFALRPIEGGWMNYLESLFIPSDNPVQPLWFLIVLFCVYVVGWVYVWVLGRYNWGGMVAYRTNQCFCFISLFRNRGSRYFWHSILFPLFLFRYYLQKVKSDRLLQIIFYANFDCIILSPLCCSLLFF